MANESILNKTQITTGVVRLSYAHVWEPVAIEDGADKKYSASLIIPKKDKATLAKIQKAITTAKEIAIEKNGGKLPKKFATPLHDGDEDREDDKAYAKSFYVNANAKTKPGIVDYPGCNEILDQSEVYSGCYARVSITFYYYNKAGNTGIACGLNNIQKIKDGEPLGGRSSAKSDFAAPLAEEEDWM
jgi:hypothetical protein